MWVDLILLWVSKVVVVTVGGWERERDKFGHGKPSFGSLEANPVLRLFMLLRLPTVHLFGLLEKHSYVGGSLLWCAYDYIASC